MEEKKSTGKGKVEVMLLLIWPQHGNAFSKLTSQDIISFDRCPFVSTAPAGQVMVAKCQLATEVLLIGMKMQGRISYTSSAEFT